jgi:hypothetical protein
MSELRCSLCGRPAEQGERLGDTCGRRAPAVFVPDPPGITIEEMLKRSREDIAQALMFHEERPVCAILSTFVI